MTPATIAGIAKLNGLDVCALTDHNTTANCPAFAAACEFYGVVPLFGMELTASEDVHMICLFDTLDKAMKFGEFVSGRMIPYPNRPDIFGDQLIMNEDDEVIAREERLLLNATTVGIDEAYRAVTDLGGACHPAHIDRDANGIVAVLGVFPDEPDFTAYELNDEGNGASLEEKFPKLRSLRRLVCSDAHRICDMAERKNSLLLPDGDVAAELIRFLRSKGGER
jgi:hypothetical protein